MTDAQNTTADSPTPNRAYLAVTLLPDGRYCVAYTDGGVSRRSYTPSLEQVIRQAQRAGGLPVRTEDSALRQRCLDANLTLI
ncbi:MAG: hypothetical protein WCI67_02930 [Chloroflexales bacterium]